MYRPYAINTHTPLRGHGFSLGHVKGLDRSDSS